MNWKEKPYYSFGAMLEERFGEKVYKVALNGGMTCPNRDGTLGSRGCIFCSAGGSGDFASDARLPIREQIDAQIASISAIRPVQQNNADFRPIPTPTHRWITWKKFLQKPLNTKK